MKLPSLTQTNHRHRGPMETHKHAMTSQQALHDIRELYFTMQRNDRVSPVVKGQIDFINDNLSRMLKGYGSRGVEYDVTATQPTNTKLRKGSSTTNLSVLPLDSGEITMNEYGVPTRLTGLHNRLVSVENQVKNIFMNIGG